MSTNPNSAVTTGREWTRWLCLSCNDRVYLGEPKAQDTWPARLSLSPLQLDLLLVAAAEFRDLSNQCDACNHDPHGAFCVGEEVACLCDLYVPKAPTDATTFLDWVRPDALSEGYSSPVNVQRDAVSAAAKAAR